MLRMTQPASPSADRPRPQIGHGVYIAPSAYVGGDVHLGDQVTVMHQVVIRGDVARITIGQRVNVQDGAIIHTRTDVPLAIADDVSIGHRAVVHCRRVGTGTLIGIGAIVLDNAEIGEHCIIAAGALVPMGMVVPDGQVLMGTPAKIVRPVNDEDRHYLRFVTQRYLDLGRRHAEGEFLNWSEFVGTSPQSRPEPGGSDSGPRT